MLFLDELPEFPRSAVEALRQPLEDGEVTVVRSAASVRFPARFALVGAANPCPCGHLGETLRRCRCGPEDLRRYERRLSGPLLDRIDLHVAVERVAGTDLEGEAKGEPTEAVRARVLAARLLQQRRGHVNARIPAADISATCAPSRAAVSLLLRSIDRFGLTARGFHRALRVSRTVADLAGWPTVEPDHVAEALAFRALPVALDPEAA